MQADTQESASSSSTNTSCAIWGCGCAAVCMFLVLLPFWPTGPSRFSFHGAVDRNVNEQDSTLVGDRVMAFSPDETQFAYIWRDATYRRRSGRGYPMTLTDALTVKWFSVQDPSKEHSLALDSTAASSKMGTFYKLEAHVAFAPDSRHFAALSPNVVIIVDSKSGAERRLKFKEEHFRALRWLSSSEILFSTIMKGDLTYWRLQLNDDKSVRTMVHQFEGEYASFGDDQMSYRLEMDRWSPDGRFAVVGSSLLNVTDGTVQPLPVKPEYVYWGPDSSSLLVYDGLATGRFILIGTKSNDAYDMTNAIHSAVGRNDTHFIINGWTPDGRYILCSGESDTQDPKSNGLPLWRGYLFQPKPFKTILTKDDILWPSPLSGWVLLGGIGTMNWVDYTGTKSIPIKDYKDCVWSRNAAFAAKVEDKKVHVFRPTLPH